MGSVPAARALRHQYLRWSVNQSVCRPLHPQNVRVNVQSHCRQRLQRGPRVEGSVCLQQQQQKQRFNQQQLALILTDESINNNGVGISIAAPPSPPPAATQVNFYTYDVNQCYPQPPQPPTQPAQQSSIHQDIVSSSSLPRVLLRQAYKLANEAEIVVGLNQVWTMVRVYTWSANNQQQECWVL